MHITGVSMGHSTLFDRQMSKAEKKFIILTREFESVNKRKSKRYVTVIGIVVHALPIRMTLTNIERRISRTIAQYAALLQKHPPVTLADTQRRMETLSFVIRNMQHILKESDTDTQNILDIYYLLKVRKALKSLLIIWDDYTDRTNKELLSRINDASVHYLADRQGHPCR
jgi:hypothetical protein